VDGVGDGVVSGVAGEVGLVDQVAQGVGDLGGPVRVGVGLSGAGEITQEMLTAKLVGQLADRGC
jgi:hypothetical protein